ncbi:NADPH-dependent FMN reductase [Rhodococcus opacus]|jgi:FMN reductase|uniref:NAD(P)H-dependent oxidoreductase n=2 Tax=Rhodococcus opacus TaxID=37919 RepID=A0AAX3YBI8_RHOOP|nr:MULTISPECIES: NAD(P)H-dependent oxidoreductase [Rhodococcus]ELB90761.1 NADPH-dependent FMN reductase [Rhodococcus wratislaviensis IFP 2016]NDV09641.1 NAD(P)H-dependent oxidoreductase [Rhodococcus sp. IEGM 248]EKT81960.1 NADPH-dependent FMN reductase [Rhodococcus opacus M213]MBA8961701.1 FMN reductase [Rhodococcus opacus]MBP2202435.1 FMN reductase [Rhodococcus opacus]
MAHSDITVGVLVGNPRPASRTATVAAEVGRQVADAVGGRVGPVVDLAMHGGAVLDPDSATVQRDMELVSGVDILIVTSPTYKATYTGLLKGFFDRFGSVSLDGVSAVPVMVGGAAHHAMAGEVHLRPLLVELGAVVPTRSLYVVDSELDHLTDTVSTWLSREGAPLANALRTAPAQ